MHSEVVANKLLYFQLNTKTLDNNAQIRGIKVLQDTFK